MNQLNRQFTVCKHVNNIIKLNASGVYELCCLLQRSIGRSFTLCRHVCLFGIDCYTLAACNSVLLHSLTFQRQWNENTKCSECSQNATNTDRIHRVLTEYTEYRQNTPRTEKIHRVLTKCNECNQNPPRTNTMPRTIQNIDGLPTKRHGDCKQLYIVRTPFAG